MSEILIFGGTTEGRQLAEYCENNHIHADISVATLYGAEVLPCGEYVNVLIGRLDCDSMIQLICTEKYSIVIDATHPYATEVTENIRKATTDTNTSYYRLIRQSNSADYGIKVHSMNELTDELNRQKGTILSTLGSKELDELTAVENYSDRIWIRALPSMNVAEMCADKGFDTSKLILEKGPFSVQQNIQHITLSGADILVTKESGNSGGFDEKVIASAQTGITLIILARPVETGFSFDEIIQILEKYA